ncbi:MAG: adenylate/guanylate cyclase domain-containing protein [Elusimicrobia bacterium]|nr:adenylate/guanylate cyclase domain-containing protein [Elusimicrobiota bacterium]
MKSSRGSYSRPGAERRYDTGRAGPIKAPKGLRDVKGLLSSREFFNKLRKRTRENAHLIDAEIERRSVRDLTVLMCDSSGFSRKTNEFGILQFLGVMTYCYDRLIPLIEEDGGLVLSHDADNILAIFEDPLKAITAAADMHRWLRRYNDHRPPGEQYNVCIGIHRGKLLRLADNIFGSCVNIAAKLGEDLAEKDEILVTKEVAERGRKRFKIDYTRSTELGGRTLELFRVKYK